MNSLRGAALPAAVSEPALRVAARLDQLLSGEVERWGAIDPELRHPLLTLRSTVLGGGKRIRSAFCFWSFVGLGGDPGAQSVIDAGAGLEMLHAAALLHDDVIDDSPRRHGADTVHVQYASLHRDRDWRGADDRFGSGVAILLGDLALVYSDRLLAGAPPEARAIFDEVRLEVNIGQYLDILAAADIPGRAYDGGPASEAAPVETAPVETAPVETASNPADPADAAYAADQESPAVRAGVAAAVARASRICRYKTAKYTIERPLHLGAALARPERLAELAGLLSSFGLPLGEAFQLRDDLLGVFGETSVTGKPVGDDLREGKATLLATLARAEATGPAARLWEQGFGSSDLSEPQVLELRAVIEATGARAMVEAAIERLAATAQEALRALPIQPEARQALEELAAFVTARDY